MNRLHRLPSTLVFLFLFALLTLGALPAVAAAEVKLEDWIGETYAPKLMIAEAEKFIVAHASRPFFLYLPFIEPHVAIHPPRESVEKFSAEWDTEVYRGGNAYLPHPRPRAGYAAMINDLAQDRGETNNLAATRTDLIRQAKELLRREVGENEVFPVPIPGVNKEGE